MSHVLISYRHEDEPRVTRLVRALQKHGLDIWWDQKLPGGEEWRQHIEDAIDQAGCEVVVWTHGSVGPEGGFVRDEASRAKARGVLAPALLDPVAPPLGFGEIQATNLTRWRGGANDPNLLDLVEAIRAKLEQRPAGPAKGSTAQLLRRAMAGSIGGVLLALSGSLATNLFHVQDHVCTVPGLQPGLSDLCGGLHLGGRPSYAERIAWAQRPAGDCAALRTLISRFPDGAYRSKAADLLQGATVSRAAAFTPAPRTARGYVRQSEHGFASVDAAQADARKRAATDAAETTCAPVDDNERLAGADITSAKFDCRASPLGGQVCAADYVAQCRIEARAMVDHCG
jgi:hypothetical protein